MLTHIRPERFPWGVLTKLHSQKAESFKVLQYLGSNAYLLQFPSIHIFNVKDLTRYHGYDPFFHESTPIADLPKPGKLCETVEAILDEQIVSTRLGEISKVPC